MTHATAGLVALGIGVASIGLAGQSGEWTTSGFDAQRTSWMRADSRLTKVAVEDGTFTFLWKTPLENHTRELNSLTPPVFQDRLIGYRGFKTLAFLGGSADRVFAIDADLARPYWMVQLNYSAATGGQPPVTSACPGGLTAMPSRRTALMVSEFGRGGGGRGARSMSAVGEPGRGAAILSQIPARGRSAAPAPARRGGGGGGRRGSVAPVPFGGVDPLYIAGSDGFLHVLRASNGSDAEPAVPFLPPGAKASALIFIDGVVYAATSDECGASPNGLWAIDLTTPERAVSNWRTGGPGVVGTSGPAFGADGAVYLATGPVPAGRGPAAATYANAVVALDPETLEPTGWFSAPGVEFNTSPIVIRHGDRDLVAAAANDGRIYLLDGASLGGPDHRTALHVTEAFSGPGAGGSLATWAQGATRWILAPAVGSPRPDGTFASTAPSAGGRIAAFRIVETAGALALEPGWTSRSIPAPLGPIVVGDVVFAAASGEYRGAAASGAERARRSSRAVLYALDGATGRELWSSGATIGSFARGGLAAGGGQVYLVTYDNHLYAFGIPMEH